MAALARRGNRRIPADTFSETVAKFGLCPNRLWAVVGEHLNELLPDGALPGHKDHETCTFDFCEWSQKDFTTVQQRHECADRDECQSLLFPKSFLDEAILNERSVAWKLDGSALIDWPEPYMAVSHVWSDGTGAGAWPDGEVNECLYNFFRDAAKRFSCSGIWWDTICIPRGKIARNKAIDKMHNNYQDARITLVHDCFLRSWDWIDAETACFAILLSPWFSRGWTALELAMSRKVKIVFNGPADHPIIKDLDEEILAKELENDESDEPLTRHQKISKIIRNLRTGITSLDDLLGVLGSRYTSWPRDMLTIAKLLVGVELETTEQQKPHELQRSILKKLGKVSPGNLFHSSATISDGTGWCSTRLFDMPRSTATSSLQVENELNLRGTWQPILLESILENSSFIWHQTHPLVRKMLEEHLEEGDCTLLAEVDQFELLEEDPHNIGRALLVRQSDEADSYEYLGALYFHPALPCEEISDGEPQEIVILGGLESQAEEDANPELDSSGDDAEEENDIEEPESENAPAENQLTLPYRNKQRSPDIASHGWTALHFAVWRSQTEIAKTLINEGEVDVSARDRLDRQAIHLAAERGNLELVKFLHFAQDPSEYDISGVLEWAVWGGSADVVGFLLTQHYMPENMGRNVLKTISELGFTPLLDLFPEAISSLNDDAAQGPSPLHIAAEHHHTDVVAFLIESTADLNGRDEFGRTALHVAAASGSLPIVKLLVNDDNINLVDRYRRTPLQQALLFNRPEVARFLIEQNSQIRIVDPAIDWTPLHFAAYHGDLETAQQVIMRSEDMVNFKDRRVGWTALHLAAMQGHIKVAKALLDAQAVPHEQDFRGWTPGMLAVFKENSGIVKALGGASQNHPGSVVSLSRWTDLHFAAIDGQLILKLLKQKVASKAPDKPPENQQIDNPDALPDSNPPIDPTDRGLDTVIGYAAMQNRPNLIKLLLKWGEDINTRTRDGASCLHYTASSGSVGLTRYLLEHGAKSTVEDRHGQMPLHWAVKAGTRGTVDLLIKRGSDPNSRAFWRRFRPIHYAVYYNRIALVDLLMNVGGDITATEERGQTALGLAIEQGNLTIVTMMIERGVNFYEMQFEGTSMLQLAAELGRTEIAKLLLSKGADVGHVDMNGFTALHYAAWRGQDAVVSLLLEKGANINVVDSRGYTPFHVAREHLHDSTVSLLHDRGASDDLPPLPQETVLRKLALSRGEMNEVLTSWTYDHPLHQAIRDGDVNSAKTMIKSGYDEDRDVRPLHVAVKHGRVDIADLLIDKDPDLIHAVYDLRVTRLVMQQPRARKIWLSTSSGKQNMEVVAF